MKEKWWLRWIARPLTSVVYAIKVIFAGKIEPAEGEYHCQCCKQYCNRGALCPSCLEKKLAESSADVVKVLEGVKGNWGDCGDNRFLVELSEILAIITKLKKECAK